MAGLERVQRYHVLFKLYVFRPCTRCSPANGTPLRRELAWPPWKLSCSPAMLLPFHREWFGTEILMPGEPNGSLALCTATIISFDLLQSCPRGPILLPRTHDITYIINNYNIFTDGWTDGHSYDRVVLKVNTTPSSSLLPTPPVFPFAYLFPLREERSKLVVEWVRSIFPLKQTKDTLLKRLFIFHS